MRSMLARASDLRAEEQRQMVELIDEIRNRLRPIEGDGWSRACPPRSHRFGCAHVRQDHVSEMSVITARHEPALAEAGRQRTQ
jgi:hypothetical protein